MKIAVFGAGSVGAYVGGKLLAGGADVVLIGRARMRDKLHAHGLLLTDLHGRRRQLAPQQIRFEEEAVALGDADLILVTVKSADTAAAAEAIALHARQFATVLSLQNGVGNADVLRALAGGRTVLAGMVPFNVLQMEEGRFHQGTEGELMVEDSPAVVPWLAAFEAAGLPLRQRGDFLAVQWGKLLLNLNNPVNALSGLPLKAQLSQRSYRRCLALLIAEALSVLHAAGIRPAQVGRIKPGMLPLLLRLPDFMFSRIAAAMLRIDPEARSSMWEDLQAGRRTEADYLNGAVLALAAARRMDAPANRRMLKLVQMAEQRGSAPLDGDTLYRLLTGRVVRRKS